MKLWKKLLLPILTASLILSGCSAMGTKDTQTDKLNIDNSKWNYNSEDDVYWQVGISYCNKPADTKYETLGIFVPGAYMTAKDNGDGTYTCEMNKNGKVEGYTAETAPIVIPVDTPGYSAMQAPSDYSTSSADYTGAGFIYVNAGCRGRDAGAPAGVTDLKAAIRFIRSVADSIPGSTDSIFTFGMSGGGAQSALVGATGDSDLYTPYLEEIGAVMDTSDAVKGSMCWCPITNLDYADEAYEWNMGSTRTDLNDEMKSLSDNMAAAFAEYINQIGLKDSSGNVLSLDKSESGIYQSGSYYDYIKSVIEQSLNHFLADTTFPYTSGGSGKGGANFDLGDIPDGEIPDDKKGDFKGGAGKGGKGDFDIDSDDIPDEVKEEFPIDDNAKGGYIDANGEFKDDGINRNGTDNQVESKTYQTAQEYIDDLNTDGEWITYDSKTNTAKITSVEAFVSKCKNASKNVGAFDDLDKSQGENTLFGYGDGNGAHFDSIMAELLKGTEYEGAFTEDLAKTDSQGNTVDVRLNMYNPLYYLNDYYEGYNTSTVAKYWRIRTGINQGDTALSTEVNLALALEEYGADVDFETVWGQGHVEAERTGNSTENFISWVNDCML
ncbi:MAG: subtype A tannase [Eubacterium sp.]